MTYFAKTYLLNGHLPKSSRLVIDAIGLAAIFSLIAQMCGYGFESMQFAIFNKVFFTTLLAKLFLTVLAVVVIIHRTKINIVWPLFIRLVGLFLYILFLVIQHSLSSNSFYHLVVGFNEYYSLFFIFPLVYQLRGYVSTKSLTFVLVGIGVPAICLGMFQYFTHIIFPLPQPGNSVDFFSRIRAYSFFGQPLQYSIFLLFIFSLCSVMLIRCSNAIRIFIIIAISIIIFAAYTTLARSLFVALTGAAVTSIVIKLKFPFKRAIIYNLPLMYFIFIILLLYYSNDISRIFSGSLTSSLSVSIRYDEWIYYLRMLLKSPSVFFLGNGIVQGNETAGSLNSTLPIDNSFLGVTLNIGVIGLFLYLFMLSSMWNFIVQEYEKNDSIMVESALVFFSTWPIYAVTSNILYLYPLCVLIYFIGARNKIGN